MHRPHLFRIIGALLTALVLFSNTPRAEAVTGEEWQLMTKGNDAAAAGDYATALTYWTQLVPMFKTRGDVENCGNYAKKSAHALDDMGRYAEALQYYDEQIKCYRAFGIPDDQMTWEIRRAEQLRPRLQVFVSRPTDGLAKTNLAKHEPAFGALYGGTIDQDPAVHNDLQAAAATYGKPYGMVMLYGEVGGPLPGATLREVREAGVPLQIAWQPVQGLDKVTEPVVRSFAEFLSHYDQPIYLRFGNEMNGNWVQWYGNPGLYVEKFRLVARIMREVAPNVAMVWAPNYVGADYNPYYPGDEWVDWVGVSAYHDAYYLADMNQSDMMNAIYYQGMKANPLDKLKEIYSTFADRKPIMIAETGYNYSNKSGVAKGLPPYDASTWAAETARYVYAYLPMVYPRIKAVGHFNVVPSLDKQDYAMSENPTLLKAVRAAIADDWYLSSLDQTPDTYWHPMEQATLQGKTHVASYVWLGDVGMSKVEYLLDGKVVASSYKLPFEADLDLSGLTGQHKITVKAYDKAGRLATSRDYPFDASPIRVKVNDRYVDFDQQPVIENGTTLVPMRAIAEALGAEVSWEAATRTAIAKKDGKTLRLQVDNPVPLLNGIPQPPLAVPTRNIGGRTMIPARIVAETFGMTVGWDGANRTVIIEAKQ